MSTGINRKGEQEHRPLSRQGSKKLPAVPTSEESSPNSRTTTPTDRRSNGTMSSYGPYFLEYSLLAEFNQVKSKKLPGIYVIPSAKTPMRWFGVLFIRQGLYQRGVFKFTVTIPVKYLEGDIPKLEFDLPVFHPVVDPQTGQLDVKRTFPKWRQGHHHIWQLLLYARRIFYKIETAQPSNARAATLYDEDRDLFKSEVAECVSQSLSRLYDAPKLDDPHAICFSPYDPAVHGEARQKIFSPKDKGDDAPQNAQTSGLSWVKPGTVEIFAIEER